MPRSEHWRMGLWATGTELSKQYPALAGPDDGAVRLLRVMMQLAVPRQQLTSIGAVDIRM